MLDIPENGDQRPEPIDQGRRHEQTYNGHGDDDAATPSDHYTANSEMENYKMY